MTAVCPAHRRTDPAQLRRLDRCAGPRADAGHRRRHRLRRDHPLRQRGPRAAPRRADRRAARAARRRLPAPRGPRQPPRRPGSELRGRRARRRSSWRCASGRPRPAGAGAWAASASIRELGVTIGTYQETTALRDAEERFQRAFEDAGDRHGHHRHRRALRARQPLAGGDARAASPEELAGVAVRDLTHPAHHEDDREAMRALAAGELNTYSAEKRYLRADGSEAWVALRRDRRAQRRRRARSTSSRRWPTSASAAPPSRRWPRARSASGRWPSRLARRHLRHRRGRPPGLRQRAPARDLRPARRGPRRRAVARARRRPRTASAVVGEFRRARALGDARLARRARRGRHRPLGAHPHGAGLQGAAGQPTGLVGTIEDVTVEVDRADGARRARGRVPHAGRALHRLPLAPHARRPFLYASPVARAHARLGLRGDARPDARASSGSTTPTTWRSSSATGSQALREERSRTAAYRARRRDGSIVWLETTFRAVRGARRRGARDGLRRRATSPSARAPSSSSPTAPARRAHRAAQPHAVPRPPRPGAAALAPARRAAWPCSSSTSTASRSSTTRSATRPATGCSSTSPCG